MAMSMAMATAFVFLLFIAPAVYGAEHVVGGNAGWTLSQKYQSWSAGRKFVVGDTLVFRYGNTHAVQIVDQEDYNDCDSDDDNQTFRDGNTTITLQNPGPMYFICPTPGHCAAGQKLSINVQAAGAAPRGSPEPKTPSSPRGSPSPIHKVEHIVGGKAGWTLSQNYQSWAAGRTFIVGDTLVFTYGKTHAVQIVDQEDYNDCDVDDDNQTFRDGNTTITLLKPGPMYFISPGLGDCAAGMKLAINVQAATASPHAAPTPSSPRKPPSPVHVVEHVVGGNTGWTLSQNYQNWAVGRTFAIGDTLVFRYGNTHAVQIVGQEDYNDCDPDDDNQTFRDGNTTIILQKPGPMYFICPMRGHCSAGMKLAINVQATNAAPRGYPAAPTPSSSPRGSLAAPIPSSSPRGSPAPKTSSSPSGSPVLITPSGSKTPISPASSQVSQPLPSGGVSIFGDVNHPMLVVSTVMAAMLMFLN